ncbi:MAG: hypothetical protein ABIP94_20765 [Planctomycetota bacterium]
MLLTLLSLCACGTTASHERTTELATQFATISGSLTTLKQHVNASMQGISTLTANSGGDAVGAYDMIKTAAAEIGPGIDAIKNDLTTADKYGSEHFDSWSRQNATIQNAELRARASERQNELSALMHTTSASVTKAVAMGQGFQQSLQDLRNYLSSDLSPTAIGNAADLIARIGGEAGRFSAGLDSAQKDATHMANKLGG